MNRKSIVKIVLFLVLLSMFFLFGCENQVSEQLGQGNIPDQEENQENQNNSGSEEEQNNYPTPSELALIKANEAGKVMILMYHVIGADKESDWAQTTANFRRDLQMFYDQGYSLISLKDFVNNNISTPAGKTPLVLTFDDGTVGHCRYIETEDGTKMIDPECVVGILLDFGRQHPDFGHTATFYVNNDPPFSQKGWQDKLRELVELGFDIGNHTITHAKLNKLSAEGVQKELAGIPKLVEETVPGYKVTSLALPYGLSPQEYHLAVQGSSDGYAYEHQAVLKVGANPALSPVVEGFDPTRLPRVMASTVELEKWLAYFQKNPGQRYISDGNPQTIAIPAEKEEILDQCKLAGRVLIKWGEDTNTD
jgi:peptidoglycan/xylan/chitin deacetylase (PgdA/CDA1 family)